MGSDNLTSLPSPRERGGTVAFSVIATHMLHVATPVTLFVSHGAARNFPGVPSVRFHFGSDRSLRESGIIGLRSSFRGHRI